MLKHLLFLLFLAVNACLAQSNHDLQFTALSNRWDEAIPLGNGMVGALVWQKGNNLRFSLDRADLWDNRPMKGLQRNEFSYRWVTGQVIKKEYNIVQKYFDEPYNTQPAPSKIPGGALEFSVQQWGKVVLANLSIQDALCEVRWDNGVVLKTFVHARQPVGWFRFEHLSKGILPDLIAPDYQATQGAPGSVIGESNLGVLGYKAGNFQRTTNFITYRQPGWNGFEYMISVGWKKINDSTIEGVWSISAHYPDQKRSAKADLVVQQALKTGYQAAFDQHKRWWQRFWQQSAIHLPDPLLEKQWYRELYKFGSATRKGAPPISLQAVWTADDGNLPPWKGDYHHDLNTQLSYWPGYSANHLPECMAYPDHLDANKVNYRKFTRQYFGKAGLNVPGVTTLDGSPMGG